MGDDQAVIVDVNVLHISGCPSWRLAVERVHVAAALCDIPVRVGTQRVENLGDAELIGFTGSPTILVQRRDPFSQPGMPPAMACRLYPTPDGPSGSPTVEQLVQVLREFRPPAGEATPE